MSNCFCLSSKNWFTLKGENLGTNFFFLEKTPVHKGFDVQESKQEVTKVFTLIKW